MLKRLVKGLFRRARPLLGKEDPVWRSTVETLQLRVQALEYRLLGRRSPRFTALDELADYLVGAEVEGDYVEFGVWQGANFAYAWKVLTPCFPRMRFFAADSFQGLPRPRQIDAEDGYSSNFHENDFACSRDEFLNNLQKQGVDPTKVACIPGWFQDTLNDAHPVAGRIDRVAAAWIDCDLYESTVSVLSYLTRRMSVGTVLLFDDWRCFRNLPERGQQRACREWLDANPRLGLRELFSFGWNGLAFSVSSC